MLDELTVNSGEHQLFPDVVYWEIRSESPDSNLQKECRIEPSYPYDRSGSKKE